MIPNQTHIPWLDEDLRGLPHQRDIVDWLDSRLVEHTFSRLYEDHTMPSLDRFSAEAKIDANELLKIIEDLGWRVVHRSIERQVRKGIDSTSSLIAIWPKGRLHYDDQYEDHKVSLLSFDCDLLEKFAKAYSDMTKNVTEKRDIYVVSKDSDGSYDLRAVGSSASPLIRDNYAPEVLTKFDLVISQLGTKDPPGRIILIEGEPGTGKTHFVRGLVDAMENATPILLPPSLLEGISGPNMLSAFMRFRSGSKRGPLVLILEDADQCLAPRAFDNINSINEILNLGDGILGAALDIRIVATTNAKKADIDPAILRKGRLAARISIGRLSNEQSMRVARRLGVLVPGSEVCERECSLAELYSLAAGTSQEEDDPIDEIGFSRVQS